MKVLVADDDPVSRRMLEARLYQTGYEAILAADGVEAWRVLQEQNCPTLAIVDWMMPHMDGIEVCRRVRRKQKGPYVYVILLTAKNEKEDIVRGLDSGADDYLTKPFNSEELDARLRSGRRIMDLQTELIAARESLRIQATHDSMTGLWNRRAILDALHEEIEKANKRKEAMAVLMADVDHFKKINDTYGHSVGDDVLSEVAHRMRDAIRGSDSIGRYGGEEFLIVHPRCTAENSVILAERLRDAVQARPVTTSHCGLPITVSLGVAVKEPETPIEVDALLVDADAALYKAKNMGRNRIMLASERDLFLGPLFDAPTPVLT